ncbi:ornithine carbamoyltransferase [Methylohalomonas lacus]|uniref:Ornithine carbamoyltransferase n=1 Tax=Methylohalomonas lacus TaxID=398773 RepID=A0AAE3HLU1_9GAMM|nr:ornithine carbamoyltransferase [Methylohalomonas lacus]MCS3903509.1 ornithine carbamoyltransferase [Methylohalomonas lacus]
MAVRHFLSLMDLERDELERIIQRAIAVKSDVRQGHISQPLPGRVLAMIFEKSSTRTRVSFETAMAHLGGHAIYLSPTGSQIGRGEPIEDTARVLSQMVDCIMLRTYDHATIETLAAYATVPVINGLSDTLHPCQLLADLQTWYEYRGSIQGRTVAWLGDGNNMCNSYINAARLLDFKFNVAAPADYAPDADRVAEAGDRVMVTTDPQAAVAGADLVVTDVWASMGQEEEAQSRAALFMPYQVNAALMQLAAPDALFMHCLPAHRGEEVTAEVIDGPQSVVWEEAGNRLHAQKALLEFLLAALPAT